LASVFGQNPYFFNAWIQRGAFLSTTIAC